MNQCELDEITGRLPRGRTLFHYFKDRYALMLLEDAAVKACTVSELKHSRFRSLLQKPVVRQVLARTRGNRVTMRDLQSIWIEPHLTFRLSVGQWPRAGERWLRSWHQMARPGVNLVLQMNLPQHHVREMERLLQESREDLQSDSHPVAPSPDFTLAWSRIDFDPERGEVLIEEVQSDWVREAVLSSAGGADQDGCWQRYLQQWLRPYVKIWSEAMLAATIKFAREELAARRIFYYTFSTGNELKQLKYIRPPRSLYRELPRRFCFRQTHNGPLFLRDRGTRQVKRKLRDPELTWFVLDLNQATRLAA